MYICNHTLGLIDGLICSLLHGHTSAEAKLPIIYCKEAEPAR